MQVKTHVKAGQAPTLITVSVVNSSGVSVTVDVRTALTIEIGRRDPNFPGDV